MNLYEIPQLFSEFYQLIEDQEGELTDEQYAKFADLEIDAQKKIEATLHYLKNSESLTQEIESEISRLRTRKFIIEKRRENIRNLLFRATGPEYSKEFAIGKFSWRKSESVRDIDIEQIPPQFVREKIIQSIDKIALKKAADAGEVNKDEFIEVKYNLSLR